MLAPSLGKQIAGRKFSGKARFQHGVTTVTVFSPLTVFFQRCKHTGISVYILARMGVHFVVVDALIGGGNARLVEKRFLSKFTRRL